METKKELHKETNALFRNSKVNTSQTKLTKDKKEQLIPYFNFFQVREAISILQI